MKVALYFLPTNEENEYGDMFDTSMAEEWWFPLDKEIPPLVPGTKIYLDDGVEMVVVKWHFLPEDNLIGLEVKVVTSDGCCSGPEEFANHIRTKWLFGSTWLKK